MCNTISFHIVCISSLSLHCLVILCLPSSETQLAAGALYNWFQHTIILGDFSFSHRHGIHPCSIQQAPQHTRAHWAEKIISSCPEDEILIVAHWVFDLHIKSLTAAVSAIWLSLAAKKLIAYSVNGSTGNINHSLCNRGERRDTEKGDGFVCLHIYAIKTCVSVTE